MIGRSHLVGASVLLSLLIATSAAAEPLRLGVSTWVGFGPFYIAKEKGFFDEEGVAVDLITIDEQKVRFAELAAGNLDGLATTVDTMR